MVARPVVLALALPGTGGAHPRGGADFTLTATETGGDYAPTFTGNGLLGVRVPPAGQGYAPGTVPAQSELAGFYAQPPGEVQQRANIPTCRRSPSPTVARRSIRKAPGRDSGSETAFNFLTGVGGFMQVFQYGFTGLRFGTESITLDPMLPPQMHGVKLNDLQWQGRTFTVGRSAADDGRRHRRRGDPDRDAGRDPRRGARAPKGAPRR